MPLLSFRRRALLAVFGLLAAVLVAGCASVGLGSTEQIVRERAQARWSALIERDWKTAYGFMTPAYRAIVPLNRYGDQFIGGAYRWERAEVDSVKCEESRCIVRVGVTVRLLLPGQAKKTRTGATTYFDETWVREGGQWYKFEPV